MVKRTSFESDGCPIARSLDAIGDWWSLLIIRDAFLGQRRFGEFQKSLALAKNILTVRLRALVDDGILTTAPASDGSAYQEYLLTPKGRGVFPVLVALRQWSEEFDDRPEEIAHQLVDREKGRPVRKLELRSQDGRLLDGGATPCRSKPNPAAKHSGAPETQSRDLIPLVTTAYDSLLLPRSRRYSSASSSAIRSKWPSSSSLWLRASRTRSAAVSAMKAAASSGPPSPRGSSSPERRPLPRGGRFRPVFACSFLLNNAIQSRVLMSDTSFKSATLGRYFATC